MKDATVDEEAVYRHGWRDPRISEHRVPGEGCIDFPAVIRALTEVGYDGPLTLDHVHPPTDTVERFQKAADCLRGAIEEAQQVT
jgi:sugar phosphate isomerase/epimerase